MSILRRMSILTGRSVKGTIHAIREGGALYCDSEVRITDVQEKPWTEVTCKTCLKRRDKDRRILDY